MEKSGVTKKYDYALYGEIIQELADRFNTDRLIALDIYRRIRAYHENNKQASLVTKLASVLGCSKEDAQIALDKCDKTIHEEQTKNSHKKKTTLWLNIYKDQNNGHIHLDPYGYRSVNGADMYHTTKNATLYGKRLGDRAWTLTIEE